MSKSRQAQSEVKLQAALDLMRRSFSTTEFRRWDATAIVKAHRIGGCFPTVLNKIGAIEVDFGLVKLTPRMEGLKPSTIRKHMNKYANGNRKSRKVPKVKAVSKAPAQTVSTDFNDLVIALKAKLKQEVMAELLQTLN